VDSYSNDLEVINRQRAQPQSRIPPVHRAGCDWSGRTLLLVSEEGAKEGRRGVREPPGGQPSERMVVPNVSLPEERGEPDDRTQGGLGEGARGASARLLVRRGGPGQ